MTLNNKNKIIRITTVPMTLCFPLRGQARYMNDNGFELILISSDGVELPQTLVNESCKHIVVPMTRKITPWQDLKCIAQLVKIFKEQRPSIVHTETPKAGLLGMIAAKICGIPIRIHTIAGLPLMVEKGLKLWILKWIEKITYGCATNVWPNSNSLKTFVLKNKFTSLKKIKVIGKGSSNGVDTQRFNKKILDPLIIAEVKNSIHYKEEFTYLLFIGRLVLDKGIVELVNVFKKLHVTNPSLRLVLAGQYETELDPLPKEIVDEIFFNNNIVHVSWTDKVEYYMAITHYFVFPSYREGFPNVLLEAAAMELPIICSRIAGNVDIVCHNETGLIFESMNEVELEQSLVFALKEKEQMGLMAKRLFETVTTVYKREKFWKSMQEEYINLLKI